MPKLDIVRWLVLVSIIAFIMGIVNASHAAELGVVNFNFDAKTLTLGFTAKSADKQLWLPILPGHLTAPASLTIRQSLNERAIPENLQPISDFFVYDLKAVKPGILDKPQLLSFAYRVGGEGSKSIYYFDRTAREWRALPSKVVDPAKGIIQAKTVFPYAEVVVMEERPGVFSAQSAMVYNTVSNEIVFQKNSGEVRSLASLTKLMTALVFIENNPGWNHVVTMSESDNVGGAALYLPVGTQLSVRDLFNAMLVGSKNNAVMALVRSTGLPTCDFVSLMNEKARKMGLVNTYFVEPTGLDSGNVSTAEELMKIAESAFAQKDIREAASQESVVIRTLNTGERYTIKSTSEKVMQDAAWQVTGTKTGWTSEAGYNLVTKAKKDGKEVIALVMGCAITKNYEEVNRLLSENLLAKK